VLYLFHLLVPGGKWLTTMSRPSSLASLWSSRFQPAAPRAIAAPPSAVISNRVAGDSAPTDGVPPVADAVSPQRRPCHGRRRRSPNQSW